MAREHEVRIVNAREKDTDRRADDVGSRLERPEQTRKERKGSLPSRSGPEDGRRRVDVGAVRADSGKKRSGVGQQGRETSGRNAE